MDGRDITNATPAQIMAAGIGRIPEDRHASVVGEMSVAENLVLDHLDEFTRGGVLDRRRIRAARRTADRRSTRSRPHRTTGSAPSRAATSKR